MFYLYLSLIYYYYDDRYCLDTFVDKNEWRRKGLETCYECYTKTFRLKSVCIACARNCLFG